MTLWERIQQLLDEVRERTYGAVLETLAARRRRRDAAVFSIALIALSAKMAKADGVVTDDELHAFGAFFSYPPEEADKVRMLFRLASEDVAGFDSYARQVARMFRDDPVILEDVLDCLFCVALADDTMHPGELDLLRSAADIFALDAPSWRRIKAAHLGAEGDDPYVLLGLPHTASIEDVSKAYRQLAKDNHPDAMVARGLPPDLVKISEHRMASINAAYQRIRQESVT